MVNQYPHTITVTAPAADSELDEQGNYQVSGTTSSLSFKGRFDGAKRGVLKRAADSTEVVYEGICYLPLPCEGVILGAAVEVKDGETVIASGTVKQFLKSGFNARLWL